jgi:hypothetical protein
MLHQRKQIPQEHGRKQRYIPGCLECQRVAPEKTTPFLERRPKDSFYLPIG